MSSIYNIKNTEYKNVDVKTKRENRMKRHKRVRAVVKGASERPRLCVFRSTRHIYGQLIDDARGITLLGVDDRQEAGTRKPGAGSKDGKMTGKTAIAYGLGVTLAEKALKKGIDKIVFDRRGYKYHGRVKALAEGARKGGLKF